MEEPLKEGFNESIQCFNRHISSEHEASSTERSLSSLSMHRKLVEDVTVVEQSCFISFPDSLSEYICAPSETNGVFSLKIGYSNSCPITSRHTNWLPLPDILLVQLIIL